MFIYFTFNLNSLSLSEVLRHENVGRSTSAAPQSLEWAPKCPCGYGYMIMKTSRTAHNPGRKFWKCPDLHVSVHRFQFLKLMQFFSPLLILNLP